MTNPVYDKLRNCYDSIKDEIPFEPKVALVLGSGLGDYAEQLEIQGTIDYRDIEGFPVSTVPGHKGRFVFALSLIHISELDAREKERFREAAAPMYEKYCSEYVDIIDDIMDAGRPVSYTHLDVYKRQSIYRQ